MRIPPRQRRKIICLVASPGGHFYELYLLKAFWSGYDRFWVTFKSPDTSDLLVEEEVHWTYKIRRNALSYLKAFFWLLRLFYKKRPDLILTTGANIGAVAVHAATLLGIKSVFIELTARVNNLSLAAKLSRPVATYSLVQWEELVSLEKGVEYRGRVI